MTRNGHFSRPAETDPYVEVQKKVHNGHTDVDDDEWKTALSGGLELIESSQLSFQNPIFQTLAMMRTYLLYSASI